jgi:chromosomal replication initiation ATPase DnaA
MAYPPSTKQSAFAFDWPQAMQPDNFIVSECNRAAYDSITDARRWPGSCLIIQGDPASGKTHLCQVFAQAYNAVKLNPENLGQPHWQRHRAYIADDVDRLIGQDMASEEALFHLYNAAKANDDRLLLTTTKPLGSLEFLLPDLRSRLLSSHSVALDLPDEHLLKSLYTKLFADRQMIVKPEVIDYMIKRTERTFSAAQDLVQQLDQWALATGKPVTIPVVGKFLKDTE